MDDTQGRDKELQGFRRAGLRAPQALGRGGSEQLRQDLVASGHRHMVRDRQPLVRDQSGFRTDRGRQLSCRRSQPVAIRGGVLAGFSAPVVEQGGDRSDLHLVGDRRLACWIRDRSLGDTASECTSSEGRERGGLGEMQGASTNRGICAAGFAVARDGRPLYGRWCSSEAPPRTNLRGVEERAGRRQSGQVQMGAAARPCWGVLRLRAARAERRRGRDRPLPPPPRRRSLRSERRRKWLPSSVGLVRRAAVRRSIGNPDR